MQYFKKNHTQYNIQLTFSLMHFTLCISIFFQVAFYDGFQPFFRSFDQRRLKTKQRKGRLRKSPCSESDKARAVLFTGLGCSHSYLLCSLGDRMGNCRARDICQSRLVHRWQSNNPSAIITDDNSQNDTVDAYIKGPYPGIFVGLSISPKHKN